MEQQAQTQVQPKVQAPEVQAPELTINDLANLRAIIDMSVRRGAFSAAEASGVGAAFDRLNTFLTAVAPQKAEADNTATE